METYIVKINGVKYEVEIEKKGAPAPAAAPATKAPAETAAAEKPAVNEEAVSAASAASDVEGTEVECGVAGKVWKITSKPGDKLSKGDSIMVLEAMKMEIPVAAPSDCTVKALLVNEGDPVESGQKVAVVG